MKYVKELPQHILSHHYSVDKNHKDFLLCMTEIRVGFLLNMKPGVLTVTLRCLKIHFLYSIFMT
jgi:hypothetical protein